MTLAVAIVLNSIFALAVLGAIVGGHLWAILTSQTAAGPAVTRAAPEIRVASGFVTPEPAIA